MLSMSDQSQSHERYVERIPLARARKSRVQVIALQIAALRGRIGCRIGPGASWEYPTGGRWWVTPSILARAPALLRCC